MAENINNDPYFAGRLAYFKHFTYQTRISQDASDALSEGKVVISNLEFKIKTTNREFIVSVSPVKKIDWSRFEKHINRLKEEEFWRIDSYNSQLKESIKKEKSFVDNRKEEIKNKNCFLIEGSFLNNNKEYSYNYILNTIVKPLILYEDFP